ncbi:MAG: VanZ family protein [Chloroflexota bacterium]
MLLHNKSSFIIWGLRCIALIWTLIFSYLLIQPEQQAVVHTVVQPAPPSFERELLFTSLHLLTFGFTAWLWCLALFPTRKDHRMMIVLALCLVLYGGLAEILQMQIPGRTAQWWDMTANILGIILGIGLWSLGHLWFVRRQITQNLLTH